MWRVEKNKPINHPTALDRAPSSNFNEHREISKVSMRISKVGILILPEASYSIVSEFQSFKTKLVEPKIYLLSIKTLFLN